MAVVLLVVTYLETFYSSGFATVVQAHNQHIDLCCVNRAVCQWLTVTQHPWQQLLSGHACQPDGAPFVH